MYLETLVNPYFHKYFYSNKFTLKVWEHAVERVNDPLEHSVCVLTCTTISREKRVSSGWLSLLIAKHPALIHSTQSYLCLRVFYSYQNMIVKSTRVKGL